MPSAIHSWALEERHDLAESLKWFNAGAKLYSPSGDDITEMRVEQLKARVRDFDDALRETDNA
jgi:hypothetical protein